MKTRLPSRLMTCTLALALAQMVSGCGSSDPGTEAQGTGGTTAGTGGQTSTGTGGGTGGTAPGTGGAPQATGGVTGSGGVSPATGGTTGSGGRGGAAGMRGTGGDANGGAVGSGGAAGASGGAPGGGGSSPGALPAGYPTPTTANRAVCMSAAQLTSANGTKYCPGGGAGPVCIQCLLGGSAFNSSTTPTSQATMEAGNYAVTVTLGGASAAQTQINAETLRILTPPVTTSAGQSVTYGFVVNVRAREGQPTQDVSAGYPGLDLYFSGPTANPPEVSAIGYALVGATTKPVMIYVASDSTGCDQSDYDYAGWGQALPQFFAPPAGIANYADSGESSSSFLASAAEWTAVKNAMTAGDWVLIQFGHNDKTTTSATFQANITQMVKDAKAKGATPVLVSPPARATFSGGTLSDQSSLHGADLKAVATAQNVAFIDLTSITTAWYNQIGANAWQQYHALGTDQTHTNIAGAAKIASLLVDAIKSQKIGLSQYLR